MYSDMYTHCHLYTSDVTVTMARSTCRRPGAGRNSELGPPSSQSTSEAQLHVSAQMGGGGGKRGTAISTAAALAPSTWVASSVDLAPSLAHLPSSDVIRGHQRSSDVITERT